MKETVNSRIENQFLISSEVLVQGMGHVSIKVAGEGTKLIIKMKDTLPERYIKLFYVESFNCGAL